MQRLDRLAHLSKIVQFTERIDDMIDAIDNFYTDRTFSIPETEPGVVPTAEQWVKRFFDATPEERLTVAQRAIDNSDKVYQMFLQDTEGQLTYYKRRTRELELELQEEKEYDPKGYYPNGSVLQDRHKRTWTVTRDGCMVMMPADVLPPHTPCISGGIRWLHETAGPLVVLYKAPEGLKFYTDDLDLEDKG